MEDLAWALGFMPALITVIVTMAVVSSFLREVVFDRLTEMAVPVASAAGAFAASAAVVGAFGFPAFVTFLLVLVASAAWDQETVLLPTVVVVEEYLDEDEARRQLATGLVREAAAVLRIRELEARLEQANTELLKGNLELQEMFKLLQEAGQTPPAGAEVHV